MPLHGRRFELGSTITTPGSGQGSGGGPVPGRGKGKGKLTLAKETILNTISLDTASRITLYETATARDSDVTRPLGIPASHNQGILAEFGFSGGEVITANPYTLLRNGDNPQTTDIYYNIENHTGADKTIGISISHTPTKS